MTEHYTQCTKFVDNTVPDISYKVVPNLNIINFLCVNANYEFSFQTEVNVVRKLLEEETISASLFQFIKLRQHFDKRKTVTLESLNHLEFVCVLLQNHFSDWVQM